MARRCDNMRWAIRSWAVAAASLACWVGAGSGLFMPVATICAQQAKPAPGSTPERSPAEQQRVRELKGAFNAAMQASDWKGAIEAGTALVEFETAGGGVAYNVACAHAKLGQIDQGVEWLLAAGRHGFAGATLVSTDPDLQPLRAHAGYALAVDAIKANRQRQFDAFTAHAKTIDPLTILPPGYNKATPAPLIVALHGSGGTGKQMGEAWRAVAAKAGAILVCPDALRPQGAGFHWQFVDEARWLALHTIEWAKAHHAVDPQRVVLTGFSQGANVSLNVLATAPEGLRGVIIVCGHYEPHVAPFPKVAPPSPPRVALLIGAKDEAADSNRQASADLKALGVLTKLEIYPNAGHSFPPDSTRELSEALEFVLEP